MNDTSSFPQRVAIPSRTPRRFSADLTNAMDNLIHLIYTSAAAHPFSADELASLLQIARESNERQGVTGMLLYSHETFFQVLEGRRSVIDALFRRIQQDERHHRAVEIVREPIAQRAFAEWSMGHAPLHDGDRLELDGMNDFFADATCFTALTAGRGKKLLWAFAKGRWRARINGNDSLQHAAAGR